MANEARLSSRRRHGQDPIGKEEMRCPGRVITETDTCQATRHPDRGKSRDGRTQTAYYWPGPDKIRNSFEATHQKRRKVPSAEAIEAEQLMAAVHAGRKLGQSLPRDPKPRAGARDCILMLLLAIETTSRDSVLASSLETNETAEVH